MRRDNPMLREVLDAYLLERHTIEDRHEETRDWDAIVGSGRIRMLTLNAPATYYLWQGELFGFEYELVQSFAQAHDLELEVIVAGDIGELVEGLTEGRGDMIAAGIVPTDRRVEMGLRFTRPYLRIREVFVTASEPIADLDGLAGRRITVNPPDELWPPRSPTCARGRASMWPTPTGPPAPFSRMSLGAIWTPPWSTATVRG